MISTLLRTGPCTPNACLYASLSGMLSCAAGAKRREHAAARAQHRTREGGRRAGGRGRAFVPLFLELAAVSIEPCARGATNEDSAFAVRPLRACFPELLGTKVLNFFFERSPPQA